MFLLTMHSAFQVCLCLLALHVTCKAQVLHGIPYVSQQQVSGLQKTARQAGSGSERATALLLLSAYYLQDPYPGLKNLNTSLRLSREAGAVSQRSGLKKRYQDAQYLIACAYLRKDALDSVSTLLPSVDDSTRFKILIGLAHAYRINRSLDARFKEQKSRELVLQAIAIGKKLNDTLKNIMAARALACVNSDAEEPGAEKELLDVIDRLKAAGYPYLQYTYDELFWNAQQQGNDDKAFYYSSLALKFMAQTKDSTASADLLLDHALILRKIGQHAKSLEYVNLAIDRYKIQYGDLSLSYAVHYLAQEMLKLNLQAEAEKVISKLYHDYPPDTPKDSLEWMGSLGTLYELSKNYPKAEKIMKMTIAIQERQNYRVDYYGMGKVYLGAGKYEKARPYLEKALHTKSERVSMRAKAHLHYCLFIVDSAMGNYLSAIRHLSQNKRYDDTVLKQSKLEALEKYKAEFETEKKEADLKLKDQRINLLTKEQLIRDMDLKRVNFIKNVTLVGSIILLVGGILIYLLYRRKRKDSKTISRMNASLQRSLSEKEWLLKEVHHRVKNNLHTIICLLESQAMYLEKDALQAIEKSQHRIYAMSLIHQKLYQNEDLQSIDMSIYLEEFIRYLKDSFDAQKIDFIIQVEPVQLNLQQAIPVALIINEGVTNSIKYAFTNEEAPAIRILMTQTGEEIKLVITDNGKGFIHKENDEGKSLGMQLIRGLSKELKGTVRIAALKGTTLTIEFTRTALADQMFEVENFSQ